MCGWYSDNSVLCTLKALPTLSQKSATVAENGEIRRLSHFSATAWTGLKTIAFARD